MQIILMEKVPNLGNLGDVVKVRDGYARNFLIPQHKATRATAENLAEFEARRAELESKEAQVFAEAQAHFEKLHDALITITQKSGLGGKLFGSVTASDIAEAITLHGVTVSKETIRLSDGPLKTVGEHEVKVFLHHDIVAKVKIVIAGEE